MISFEQALQTINSFHYQPDIEKINLQYSLKRILAEDIVSDIDMPPFHKAAMDGYACRKSDLAEELEIIEEIPAGKIPQKIVRQYQCSRIMTGAMVPQGADFILMKEHVLEKSPGKIIRNKETSNTNICYQGEDIKKGDVVLQKGLIIGPPHIAVMASSGISQPIVYKQPSISVISTGNELVEPDKTPGTAQIRNSNSYQLCSQIMNMGLHADYKGIVKDIEKEIEDKLNDSLNNYQLTIISGGVSVGDYDFIPKILQQLQVRILFHGLNAKPGKHLLFGVKNNHFIFGMPGNPVSSFVQFEVLVKPLLFKLMGTAYSTPYLNLKIKEDYQRKKNEVLGFIPIFIHSEGFAEPLEYHGSAHIHSYTLANGIMEIPIGIKEIKKGDIVRVRPL